MQKSLNTGGFIFVSLYLFIMIFFILLVSVTKPQKSKQQQTILSVAKQFSSEDNEISPEKSVEIAKMIEIQTIKKIRNLMPSTFQEISSNHNSDHLITIEIDPNNFFKKDKKDFKIPLKYFLNDISEIIKNFKAKQKLQLEISMNGDDLSQKRMAHLTSYLIKELNFPKKSLKINLLSNNSANLRFNFVIDYEIF